MIVRDSSGVLTGQSGGVVRSLWTLCGQPPRRGNWTDTPDLDVRGYSGRSEDTDNLVSVPLTHSYPYIQDSGFRSPDHGYQIGKFGQVNGTSTSGGIWVDVKVRTTQFWVS